MKFASLFLTLVMFLNNGSFFNKNHSPFSSNSINELVIDRYYFEKPYKCNIHSFVVSAKYILSHSPLKVFIYKDVVDIPYYFGLTVKNMNEEVVYDDGIRVKEGVDQKAIYFNFYVDQTSKFIGLMEFNFYVRCEVQADNTHYYAKFKLYFPHYEVIRDRNTLKVPWEASVYPDDGYVDVKSEHFEVRGLDQSIILPSYSSLDFNELTFSIYCHIYQRSYLKRVNASLTILNKEILVDEKGDEIPFIYANSNIKLKVNPDYESSSVTLSLEEKFYIDKDSFIASKNKSENSFESNEIYFPQGYINYFQNIEFGLKIEAGCLTFTTFIYPFKLNFIKDYEREDYKIVGELNGEIEDEDLEEVILP